MATDPQAFLLAYADLCVKHGLMLDPMCCQDALWVTELGGDHPEFIIWTDEAKEKRAREIEGERGPRTVAREVRANIVRRQIGERHP